MSREPSKTAAGHKKRSRLLWTAFKVALVIVAVVALVVVAKMPAREGDATPTEAPPVNVAVMTVQAEPRLLDTFELPAVVEPNRVVTVSAEVSGRIEKIPQTEGSVVQSGALLVQLNADLIRPQVEVAQAQYDRTKIEYERMAGLVKMDATSRSDLDNATKDLATSKAQLAEKQAQLERTRILAPLSGVLNDLPVEEGEYVQPGMPVAELVETNPAKVVVDVPARDIRFFEVGEQATVLDARDKEKSQEKLLVGTISFIDAVADPQTRSTRMEIVVPNEDGALHSGQIVRVRLTRRVLENAILIPLLAVIPMEEGQVVYVVNSGKAQRREIEFDIIRGDRIRVTEGLKPGEKLIVSGHRFVAPGQKVAVVSEKE